ncbi:GNAT family N-acetyltransferase [Patulibacter sp.]|uniref:GNAT family N-acetyltransferase n=1 Tax=Patulibacter sp. TaxID=1912859 RepID=UPI00271BF500|nr:GNAT family protein [Patulibacter sp.]MDO9410498.1 GNAT family protein [Patulibacter sp.]
MGTGTDDAPTLVGPRVRLRPPTAHDADAFVVAVRASADLHRGWATAPDTPEAFAAYLARLRTPAVEGFLVVRGEDDALVGRVTLSQIFRGDFQNAYVGYEAFAGHERRGHLTEGVGLALDHAFGALGLHRVEANVQPGNVPSLALVRRLGFRREGLSRNYLRVDGLWRDHERWAILADEHRAGGPDRDAP